MTIDMGQFFQVFFEETEELLAEMEKLLLAVDVSNPDPEDLNAIFRAAHSIKGGASTFGITDLGEVTHVLETLLDRIRKGETLLTAEHVEAFLAAKDILKMQLDGHRLGSVVDLEAVGDIRMLLQSLSEVHRPIPVQVVPLAIAVKPDGDYAHRFHIELPVISERDTDALAAELGLLGFIVRSHLPDQRAVFELATNESVDDIIALCSFVLDPDALKITLLPAPASASDAELGYGFFEPIDSRFGNLIPAVPSTLQEQEARQGYGFFAPFVPQGKTDAPAEAAIEHEPAPLALTESQHDALAGQSTGDSDKRAHQRRENEKTASAEASSIRVSIEKVDQLINLVGELVITQAMIEQRTDTLDPMKHERLLDSVSQLTRNTRDLQEAVMSIRMMQMDYVFARFPRMVRDLATKLGKKVDFVTVGAATELDKGLIERIVDPLTHLVRNSIDHGIETPAIRLAGGKSETGRLSLSAGHQGGNIVIEVSDDGGGLNRERILRKAAENGLPVSDDMTDPEVWQLIFAPGFSTADIVTDVSGRGVGMDVVKRNITAMGGVVDIRSAKGFGTTISIALPLTLAILDGMSIRVGDEVYILPLGYVVESLQPRAVDVKEISGQGQVIKVRGEYLPLIPLHQMFGIAPRYTNPSEGIVVILESEGRKAGLFVDDLVGQQQVVVKNLESNYRKVAGISGATILGDGGVSLIVDVAALLRSSRHNTDEPIFS
ncbi:chemotaxis protein CheA [Actimicrobium sp. CCI2.3]|uniref:chemotaxis protein CheA n=1 Tax=Actimicrobium sp. CCI2.3 TaxID=3048616 RepID=UPI002AB52651|nr:chemotaxis protein CheA [Actimicrobium sp. CCI2.3]MDY7575355.1 chemotaxis protein CheA [Actimicrobium sp. CCI2.3]MEB0021267.1 chemotaxis protein CheA [Actimicrobium sp. CCI2.3]